MNQLDAFGSENNELNLLEYLDIVGKHRKVIFICAVIGLVLAVALWAIQPPLYRAKVTMKFDFNSSDIPGYGSNNSWTTFYLREELFKTEFQIIRSLPVREKVIEAVGIEFLRSRTDIESNPKNLVGLIKQLIKGDTKTQSKEGDPEALARRYESAALGMLSRNLSVSQVKDTNLVEIAFVSTSGEVAEKVANAWADAYIQYGIDRQFEKFRQTFDFLEKQANERRTNIEQAILKKSNLETENETFKFGTSQAIEDDAVSKLNNSLIQAETRLVQLTSERDKLIQTKPQDSFKVQQADRIAQLNSELTTKRQKYQSNLEIYKPQLPRMQQMNSEIKSLQSQLTTAQREVFDDLVKDIQSRVATQQSTVTQLRESLTSKRVATAEKAKKLDGQIQDLDFQIVQNRQQLESLDNSLQYIYLSQKFNENGPSDKTIVEQAKLPGSPFAPTLKRFVIIGFALGLLAAAGLIFLFEITDRKIYTADVLETLSGLPTLALIPKVKSRTLSKATKDFKQKTLSDVFEKTKNLEKNQGPPELREIAKLAQLANKQQEDDPDSELVQQNTDKIVALCKRALNAGDRSNTLVSVWNMTNFSSTLDIKPETEKIARKSRTPKWAQRFFDRQSQEQHYGYSYEPEKQDSRISIRKLIGCYTYIKPASPFAESYRHLRTNIQLANTGQKKSFVLTSSIPGEGKTVSSVNLAIAFAQQDKKVLLVDGDLRRSKLHHVFNIKDNCGMVNFLTGQATENEIFKATFIPNLYLLPAGPTPPNPSELLSSKRMHELMQRMRDVFDYIVFDSSPSLLVADACILGNMVDATIFVSKAGRTSREEAIRTLQILRSNNIKPLGTLFNDVEFGGKGSYRKSYGYRYGYGYGYGQSYGYGYGYSPYRPRKV